MIGVSSLIISLFFPFPHRSPLSKFRGKQRCKDTDYLFKFRMFSNLGTSVRRRRLQTLQYGRVDALVRVLFLAMAPQCRRGPNSPSQGKGWPEARVGAPAAA